MAILVLISDIIEVDISSNRSKTSIFIKDVIIRDVFHTSVVGLTVTDSEIVKSLQNFGIDTIVSNDRH